ncbi:MAG: ABC transporter ATP-binding protein, partial [Ekhidna sp.]
VRSISKKYQVFSSPLAQLQHTFGFGSSKGVSEVRALENVSFDIERGESLAIIGQNGSGKSTLLEIIAGTLKPSEGSIEINGRIAAMLELGSGFNPEFTGRENIRLNGLILGASQREVEEKFGEIVDFADIGEVLDRPVRTYSSGMLVRLAFSVQVVLRPEILIIDEALSVGDYFFQQKCFGHLRKLMNSGVTLLFVSHDLGTVRDLCSRAIVLEAGRAVFIGDTKLAIQKYIASARVSNTAVRFGADREVVGTAGVISKKSSSEDALGESDYLAEVKANALWVNKAAAEEIRLICIDTFDTDGGRSLSYRIGEVAKIRIWLRTNEDEGGHLVLVVKNKFDQVVCSQSTLILNMVELKSGKNPFLIFEFDVNLMLEAGLYSFMVKFVTSVNQEDESIDASEWLGPMHINWNYESETPPFLGMFGLPISGNLVTEDAD